MKNKYVKILASSLFLIINLTNISVLATKIKSEKKENYVNSVIKNISKYYKYYKDIETIYEFPELEKEKISNNLNSNKLYTPTENYINPKNEKKITVIRKHHKTCPNSTNKIKQDIPTIDIDYSKIKKSDKIQQSNTKNNSTEKLDEYIKKIKLLLIEREKSNLFSSFIEPNPKYDTYSTDIQPTNNKNTSTIDVANSTPNITNRNMSHKQNNQKSKQPIKKSIKDINNKTKNLIKKENAEIKPNEINKKIKLSGILYKNKHLPPIINEKISKTVIIPKNKVLKLPLKILPKQSYKSCYIPRQKNKTKINKNILPIKNLKILAKNKLLAKSKLENKLPPEIKKTEHIITNRNKNARTNSLKEYKNELTKTRHIKSIFEYIM